MAQKGSERVRGQSAGSKKIGRPRKYEDLEEYVPSKKAERVEEYLESKEGLALLSHYAMDGMSSVEMARRVGLPTAQFEAMVQRNKKIRQALLAQQEYLQYQVEDALLRAALGHRAKDVKITTEIRHGKVVAQFKEEFYHDVDPDVKAITYYLNNRAPDKWKKNRDNLIELSEEDKIQISITRADVDETGTMGTELVVEDVEPEYVESDPLQARDELAGEAVALTQEEAHYRQMEEAALAAERKRRKRYAAQYAAIRAEQSAPKPGDRDWWPEEDGD